MLVCLFKGYDNQVSFSDIPAGYVQAYIYFESDITEIKSEAFLVDFGNLVSSIGGSLGLFLGFFLLYLHNSCVGIYFQKAKLKYLLNFLSD